jgi:hypothetical protein
MTLLLHRTLLIFAFLLLTSCDSPSGKSNVSTERKSMDPLWNVSSELALMEAEVKMQRRLACTMSEAFANQAQPDEKNAGPSSEFVQALAHKMRLEAIAKCTALRIAEEKGATVFREIRTAGSVPAEAYFFLFVEEHEGTGNGYVSVGLFSSIADCVLSEGALRENDLATTRCRKWQATFYPQAAGKK